MTHEDESLADGIAASLEKRIQVRSGCWPLNLYDIGKNSRLESLVAFKHAYRSASSSSSKIAEDSKPHWGEARANPVFRLVPYTHGVYPLSFTPTNRLAAMSALPA